MGELLYGDKFGSAEQIEQQLIDHEQLISGLTAEGELLYAIAQAKMNAVDSMEGREVTALEPEASIVYNVLAMPPAAGESAVPRWQLIQEANAAVKQVVDEHSEEILGVAREIGMRRSGEFISREGLDRICREFTPRYIIEGGANMTSVMRRGIMERMATHWHMGSAPLGVFQLGSEDRLIHPTTTDQRTGEPKPNPEHKIIREFTGEQFAPDQTFSEFEANMATARASGYIESKQFTSPLFIHPTTRLIIFQIASKGLIDGLSKVIDADKSPARPIIATNGQYRRKSELMAAQWALGSELTVAYPMAVGDEPGDYVMYRGGERVVPDRPPLAYVNELAVYGRLLRNRLAVTGGEA